MTSSEAVNGNGAAADRLSRRIFDLVKGLHDLVVQPLTAASMALALRDLADEDRIRVREAVALALARLEALVADATDALEPHGRREAPPTHTAPLATVVRSVIAEALANVREHSSPSEVTIVVKGDHEGVVLDVLNDCTGTPSCDADAARLDHTPGVGLRLVGLQAGTIGAQLEAGPTGEAEWRVRVRIPS